MITAEQVLALINNDDVHKSPTTLVSLENTANRGGEVVTILRRYKKLKKSA